MKKRQERLDRIKAIEREFLAAKVAVTRLMEDLRADANLLRPEKLGAADVQSAGDNLEATYLLRLFAEFEAGLRDAWENAFQQTTTPRLRDLLEAVAARRHVPDDDLDDAHSVRAYRNSLVHEAGEEAEPVSFELSRKYLCRFFSRLPLDW